MNELKDKSIGEMLDYLPADEGIIGKHRVGSYDIVTTSERLICLRKFPPQFIEVHYSEINNLEHRTTIMWRELIDGIILFTAAGIIYYNNATGDVSDILKNVLKKYAPEVLSIVTPEMLVSVVVWILAAWGAVYALRFIPSLRGYFRISRKDRAPVVISTSMSPELKALIRELGELISRKDAEKIRVIPQQVAGGYETKIVEDDIRGKLEEKLKGLEDSKVVLISSKSEMHSQVVSNMLDILVNGRGMGGVYLSITRPYEFILSAMEANKIPPDNIQFIDCISMMAGKAQHGKNGNVVFIENPSSLEEVSMYLDRMLAKVNTPKKFLFLDSLSSLLIYNTDKSVKEFTHFMINKIRLENIAGVILSIEKKEAEDLVKTLTPMCDAEIRF